MQRELGTDTELLDLVRHIKSFDHEYATPVESLALTKALKIVAADIIAQHERLADMRVQLEHKLALAEVTAELSGVINTIRPRKRGWFGRRSA